MDNYYQQHNQSNYDNHHFSAAKYNSYSKRASIDSAYDSFLLSSQLNSPSSASFYSNSINQNITDYYTDAYSSSSHVFSQPTTPVKSPGFIYSGNNSSTTPDFKQQYVADINSFYFASIRSTGTTATPSTCSSYTSPYKSSLSNSPSKYDSSFVHKRDNLSSKLLRSPAFKLESPYSSHQHQLETTPNKPTIKSFNSRFQSNLNLAPPEPLLPATPLLPPTKTTPTEEEFMDMLIANHHIPDYPESLIGRNMGLDHVDILSELNKRSMNTLVEKVFSYLSTGDCVRVGCVSKEWRSLIKQDPKRNKERVKLIKQQKHLLETLKENRSSSSSYPIDMQQLEKGLLNSNLSYHNMIMDSPVKASAQRRTFRRLTCEQMALRENPTDTEVNVLQFNRLDVNCMHNLYINKPQTVLKQVKAYKSPVKKERLSPLKRCSRDTDLSSPTKVSASVKIDLIGSKKSKKNLKRL